MAPAASFPSELILRIITCYFYFDKAELSIIPVVIPSEARNLVKRAMKNQKLKAEFIEKAKKVFQKNLIEGYSKWRNTSYRFIAPASKEYTYQFLWDTAFHAIVLSHFDLPWAKSEIVNFLKGQWTDGFLPHIIFWGRRKILRLTLMPIESKFSFNPQTTAITQPPILPIAVETIYEKDKDKEFLKVVLDKLARHHRWLLENRDPDHDYLISIISPNESGMDESPVFQYVAGFLGEDFIRLHYHYRKSDFRNLRRGYNVKRILDEDYFNVEELMFNTVFIESSRSLSRLFLQLNNKKESQFFRDVANKTEAALIDKTWNKKDAIFYSLFSKEDKQAPIKTISSLIPLYLSGLKGKKLEDLIQKHLLNPKEFWRPYPVPSVSKSEPYYVPTDTAWYKIKLIWRGPTWINTNWFIVKGLRKHGHHKIADQIVEKMIEMIQKQGFREYYNPETGVGYRRQDFGWSTLIIDLL